MCFEEKYPKKLLQIKEYPEKLYYMGNVNLLSYNKIIAIVGSRDCTEYGRKYANIFAKELSENGICIISGMALGIDTAAHYGAIQNIGKTIAVLGGGLEQIYPQENQWLYNQILQNGGCIISEYEDNKEAVLSTFPKRNRIISALADAVIVIEAKSRSGSKVTAKYAKEQGKNVYCIPMNLDSKNSSGIVDLIKNGAKIVTSTKQIIADLYNENAKKYDKVEKLKVNIPKEYEEIYNLLKEEQARDEIAIKTNKKIEEINSILTIMELEGYIKQTAGNNFKAM